jgi:hypothetical protein
MPPPASYWIGLGRPPPAPDWQRFDNTLGRSRPPPKPNWRHHPRYRPAPILSNSPSNGLDHLLSIPLQSPLPPFPPISTKGNLPSIISSPTCQHSVVDGSFLASIFAQRKFIGGFSRLQLFGSVLVVFWTSIGLKAFFCHYYGLGPLNVWIDAMTTIFGLLVILQFCLAGNNTILFPVLSSSVSLRYCHITELLSVSPIL